MTAFNCASAGQVFSLRNRRISYQLGEISVFMSIRVLSIYYCNLKDALKEGIISGKATDLSMTQGVVQRLFKVYSF